MHTLKLDWTEERIEAVTLALREFARDPGGMPELAPEIRGALADILLYCRASEDAIAETRKAHPGVILTGDHVRMLYGRFAGRKVRVEHIGDVSYDVSVIIAVRKDQVRSIA